VLDINLFRKEKGGDPDLIKASQRRRFASEAIVDEIIQLDNEARALEHQQNELNREVKAKEKQIGAVYKQKKENAQEEVKELREQNEAANEKLKALKPELAQKRADLHKKLNQVGNIVHESVPVSQDEANNLVVAEWGEFKQPLESARHHDELLWMIDGYDPHRGNKVAGQRGYFLKGVGARLNLALITYGTDFLSKRGYIALQTPFFMNKDVMAKTAQLSQFDEELYKVTQQSKEKSSQVCEGQGHEDKDKYLIATSEQPISAFHCDEWLDPKTLPLRYAGLSTCFRKEAGAYGKDTWGIFRVHQFEKVEQFCITAPEKSWEEHEFMLKTSQEFYQSLGLPYHVVTIVSGELNNAAAKKYDLEGWFPAFNEFRELVSCSNCTDYQARSLEVRYGYVKQGDTEKKYVHMLNSTLCATSRTICCLLENYQTPEGIKVPAVLQPYMGGIEFIPFVQAPPPRGRAKQLEEEKKKAAEKAEKGK